MSEERYEQAIKFAEYLQDHKENRLDFLLDSLEDSTKGTIQRKKYEERLETAAKNAGVNYHTEIMNDAYTIIAWGEDVLYKKLTGNCDKEYKVA